MVVRAVVLDLGGRILSLHVRDPGRPPLGAVRGIPDVGAGAFGIVRVPTWRVSAARPMAQGHQLDKLGNGIGQQAHGP